MAPGPVPGNARRVKLLIDPGPEAEAWVRRRMEVPRDGVLARVDDEAFRKWLREGELSRARDLRRFKLLAWGVLAYTVTLAGVAAWLTW